MWQMFNKWTGKLLGIFIFLAAYPPVSLAESIIVESALTWQQHLVIDELMDTLHGPRRSTIAYRDYTGLGDEPDQPPLWPLYKQQPAFAQSDFRQRSNQV